MNTQELMRLDGFLDQALDLPPDQRERFLGDICRERPEMATMVGQFLRGLNATDAQTTAVSEKVQKILVEDCTRIEGQVLGSYQVLEEIGRGGMSRVFSAERVDGQFHRKVAVKVLAIGFQSDLGRALFSHELKVLSQLNHPHIVQMYDSGLTQQGVPYFIMEYLEGKDICDYADQTRLTLKARVNLFLTVCEAVAYAHSHMVIHRDIKPSNILVTETGRVKLTDFGIASRSAEDNAGLPLEHFLTPEFAAPEQLKGEPATAQSDVFSLGALLHLILTGTRPEMEKSEPVGRPSTLPIRSEHLVNCKTGLKALRWQLRGDLDAILMKCLHPEPSERYPSVTTLADDLRNFLENRPVQARCGSSRYIFWKLVQRHPWKIVLSSLTLSALVLMSTALYSLQKTAVRERDQARTESETARFVTDFMMDVFQVADPEISPKQSVTAYELLLQGEQKIRERNLDPHARARLLSVLANAFGHLGYLEKAHDLFAQAVQQPDANLNRQEAFEIQRDYARNALLLQSFDEAGQLIHQLAKMEREGPLWQAEVLDLQGDLAIAHSDFSSAESFFQRAQAIRLEKGTPIELAGSFQNLGKVAIQQGEYEKAQMALNHAEELFRQQGKHDAAYIELLNQLGTRAKQMGKLDAAETYFQRGLRQAETNYGPDHPACAKARADVALSFKWNGKFELAGLELEKALQVWEQRMGTTHSFSAFCRNNLAEIYYEQGRKAEALDQVQSALACALAVHGEKHPLTLSIRVNQATLWYYSRDLEKAERAFQQVIQSEKELVGEQHPDHINRFNSLAVIYLDQKKYAQAEATFSQARELAEKYLPPEHPLQLSLFLGFAQCKKYQGHLLEAIALVRQLIQRAESVLPQGDPMRGVYATTLAEYLVEAEGFEEAIPILNQNLSFFLDIYSEDHYRVAKVRALLGVCYFNQKNYSQAREYLLAAQPYVAKSNRLQALVAETLEKIDKL
ncbi:MAG: tetratricopeptide repeat protein [Acidobacteria bacterium]|nr:tetratricopeptide repeat protein [Acidobacteriota bacterium]